MSFGRWAGVAAALGVAASVGLGAGGADVGTAGEWLQFRGDRVYTGRSSLKGDIAAPEVKWKHFVGARETLVEARQAMGRRGWVTLPPGDAGSEPLADLERRWGVGDPFYDLDGHGQWTRLAPSPSHKIGRLLPDRPGIQRLSFTLLPQVGGKVHTCITELATREGGEWRALWRNDTLPQPYGLMPIVGDFDGDGRVEYAVAPIDDIFVFDLATGAQKARCRFVQPGAESGRSYGWFGAFDLDRDGKSEFVLIGDFQEHVEVMGWVGKELRLLWGRLIQPDITGKQSLVRPGTHPVADVDGDGRLEVTFSIYNETGDGRWHVVSYDGMTGKVKYDLPDGYLSGVLDCDGDGAAELFCTHTGPSRLVPEPSTLSVVTCNGGAPRVQWRLSGAAFQTHQVQDFPLNVNSCAAMARQTLLSAPIAPRGGAAFVTRRALDGGARRVALTVWQAGAGGAIRPVGRLSGPHLEAVGLAAGGLLVRARVPGDGRARVGQSGLRARVVLARRLGVPVSPVVAGRLAPRQQPTILAQGACEDLVAFRVSRSGETARVLWRVPGRGMYVGQALTGATGLYGGVLLADLLGRGELATVAATRGPQNQARLIALDGQGREIWHADFGDLPGGAPPWNTAGVTLWYAGHFTDRSRCDVLVNLRVSQDTWTALLDGRTGREIWRRKEIRMGPARVESCGGLWTASLDCDGDGLDDALIEFHDIVYALKGATGDLLFLRDTAPGGIFGGRWSFGGYPVVADFLGDGGRQLLYWAHFPPRALLDLKGNPIWIEDGFCSVYGLYPGVGDVDGDGRLEILAPGNPSSSSPELRALRCYSGSTGAWKWTLEIEGASGAPDSAATADLDGDGRDECVFPCARTLYCVGATRDGRAGEVRWSLGFPDLIGPPAIADARGDGRAQVVVTCADGHVYGVGGITRGEEPACAGAK